MLDPRIGNVGFVVDMMVLSSNTALYPCQCQSRRSSYSDSVL